MKVLYVTNMYPDEDSSYYGLFVKQQIDAIQTYYNDIDCDLYYINGRKSKLNYLSSFRRIRRMIRKNRYDLIHVHYGFSGLFLLKKLPIKIPVIITLHGGDIQREQNKYIQVYFTKRILKKADLVITLNDRMSSLAQAFQKNIVKIPCSVNTSFFRPSPEVQSEKEEYTIIFPSNKMRPEKNYGLFSRTVELLKNKYLLRIKEIELNNMSEEEVLNLFQKADLMLMTSISEGSPQVIKEAMACNLPIVSTKVGDVDFLLKGVKNTFVDESHTSEKLAEAVYKILYGKMAEGIEGREKLKELELDDKYVADKIVGIYRTLISKN